MVVVAVVVVAITVRLLVLYVAIPISKLINNIYLFFKKSLPIERPSLSLCGGMMAGLRVVKAVAGVVKKQ
jgi:hypothetical protein